MFTPRTNEVTDLHIRINADLPATRPHFEDGNPYIHYYSLSPNGVRGLFEARGEIFTVPTEHGDIRNITNSPGVFERYPTWSPDGSKIAFFSDESDEYKLVLQDQTGLEEPEVLSLGEPGFYSDPIWAPDGEKILYQDMNETIYFIELESGEITEVDQNNYLSHNTMPSWSHDSNWITYIKRLENGLRAVFVYNLEDGSIHQVTDGMSDAVSPVFSHDGKYLYFAASTNYALNNTFLDMSSYERPVRRTLYVVVLSDETENPFVPLSDEEEVEEEEEESEETSEEVEEDEDRVVIDFEGLDQRILSLSLPSAEYGNLQTSANHLFYIEFTLEDEMILHRYDISERESSVYMSGVGSYEISSNGTKLIYSANGQYGIVATDGSPSPGDGALSMSGMQVYVNPAQEWRQIYTDAWRLERDYFYDPGMHGLEWRTIYDKYLPFIEHVGHRSDLTFLIGEMIGELVVGHAYVGGGDEPDVESVNVGLLGADYTIHRNRYRFERIYSGLNWNPSLRAPLTEPGVDIEPGDYLIAVNGIELTADMNIYSLFQNLAEHRVVLTVNDHPNDNNARTVTVVPTSSESGLRFRAWVENNRRIVEEATDGRVAYVYMPNTAWAGYTSFNRYYFAQVDHDAVIVDERWNGGGSAADYIVDMLDRPLLNWWVTREGLPWVTPMASIFGPKVMIINESAGSGGDAMPAYFRRRGLGQIIGKRTWGGLVGISGSPTLMDNGYVTVPSFGIVNPDSEWEIENEGVSPDIEVEYDPVSVINGVDPQLQRSIEVILQELESNPPPVLDPPEFPRRAVRER